MPGDIPKTVERYVDEHKEQGADEEKAWALAWSRYCKYKNPDSPHCKQDSYFDGRESSRKSFENVKKELLERAKHEYIFPSSGLSTHDTAKPVEVEALRELKNEGKVEWHAGKGYRISSSLSKRVASRWLHNE